MVGGELAYFYLKQMKIYFQMEQFCVFLELCVLFFMESKYYMNGLNNECLVSCIPKNFHRLFGLNKLNI